MICGGCDDEEVAARSRSLGRCGIGDARARVRAAHPLLADFTGLDLGADAIGDVGMRAPAEAHLGAPGELGSAVTPSVPTVLALGGAAPPRDRAVHLTAERPRPRRQVRSFVRLAEFAAAARPGPGRRARAAREALRELSAELQVD